MDVLYLLPDQDNPLAARALELLENQQHVREVHLPHRPLFTATRRSCRCLAISIDPVLFSSKQPWTFSVSSRKVHGIYLPLYNGIGRIDLLFGYAYAAEDVEDSPGLFVRNIGDLQGTCQPKIFDPISVKEATARQVNYLGSQARFLSNPYHLSVGQYRFLLFRAFSSPDRQQLISISSRLDLSSPETDWRKIGPKLGRGAFGKVDLVRGMAKGQLRACKTMNINITMPATIAAARNELSIMKQLGAHENVVKCFADHEEMRDVKGKLCNVFKFYLQPCHGDLHHLVWANLKHADHGIHCGNETNLALPFLPEIAKQMISAVAYIHDNGFLHRDIKPGNIMFRIVGLGEAGFEDTYGIVKRAISLRVIFLLGDFGLSKTSTEVCRSFVGTEMYLAPEIEDDTTDHTGAVDIMSLGISLLEVLFPKDVRRLYGARHLAQDTTNARDCQGRRWYRGQIYDFASRQTSIHPLVEWLVEMMNPVTASRPCAAKLITVFDRLPWNVTESICNTLARGQAPACAITRSISVQDVTMLDVPNTVSHHAEQDGSDAVRALKKPRLSAGTIITTLGSNLAVPDTSETVAAVMKSLPKASFGKHEARDLQKERSKPSAASGSSDVNLHATVASPCGNYPIPGAYIRSIASISHALTPSAKSPVRVSDPTGQVPGAYEFDESSVECSCIATLREGTNIPSNSRSPSGLVSESGTQVINPSKQIDTRTALPQLAGGSAPSWSKFPVRLPKRDVNATQICQLCEHRPDPWGSSLGVNQSTLLRPGQRNAELKVAGYLKDSLSDTDMTIKARLSERYSVFKRGLARVDSLDEATPEGSIARHGSKSVDDQNSSSLIEVGCLGNIIASGGGPGRDVIAKGLPLVAEIQPITKPRGILKPGPCGNGTYSNTHLTKRVNFGATDSQFRISLPIRSIDSRDGGSVYYPAVEVQPASRTQDDGTATIKPTLSGNGSKRSFSDSVEDDPADTRLPMTTESNIRLGAIYQPAAVSPPGHNSTNEHCVGSSLSAIIEERIDTAKEAEDLTSPVMTGSEHTSKHHRTSTIPSNSSNGTSNLDLTSPSNAAGARTSISTFHTLKRKRGEGGVVSSTSPSLETRTRKITWRELLHIAITGKVEVGGNDGESDENDE